MRTLTWGVGAEGIASVAGGGGNSSLDLLADYKATLGVSHLTRYTVTRIIGQVYWRALTLPSLDDIQQTAFGIRIQDENVGATSSPSPVGENANWMWQQVPLWVPWTVQIADGGAFRQLLQVLHFDIRTQRIFRGTESKLLLTINNLGGEAISVDVRTRTLVRIP